MAIQPVDVQEKTILTHIPISKGDAEQVAAAFVTARIDPAFTVASGQRYYNKPLGREVWRFIICSKHGPLAGIHVDAQSGQLIPPTSDDIRIIQERAVIVEAESKSALPTDEKGYILSEYARRRANSYLSMNVSISFSAIQGKLFLVDRAIWQFTIEARLPQLGMLGTLGTIDVNARTGEVIPLTQAQLERIREHADALVKLCAQNSTP